MTKLSGLLAKFDEKIQQSILDSSNPTKKGIDEREAARAKIKAHKDQNQFSSSNPDWVPGVKDKSPNSNNGQTHGSATASIHD